jgi:hypothetical protein
VDVLADLVQLPGQGAEAGLGQDALVGRPAEGDDEDLLLEIGVACRMQEELVGRPGQVASGDVDDRGRRLVEDPALAVRLPGDEQRELGDAFGHRRGAGRAGHLQHQSGLRASDGEQAGEQDGSHPQVPPVHVNPVQAGPPPQVQTLGPVLPI